jgi:hypothetical protein
METSTTQDNLILLEKKPVLDSIHSGLAIGGIDYLVMNYGYIKSVIEQVFIQKQENTTAQTEEPTNNDGAE